MDAKPANDLPVPPLAERRPLTIINHEIERTDDYAWLRADNWQQVMREPAVLAEDIRAYLTAENAYTEAAMKPTAALQETLFQEMKGRIKEDDSTVPSPDGDWAYFRSYVTGGQHPLFCREPRDGGARQVLLDGNKLAEGLAYFDLGGVGHSHDHTLLAFATDDKGSEYYTLKIRNIATGELLPDVIENVAGYIWSADGQWLFYARLDDNHRPRQVFRHRLGTSPDDDILVYEESDSGFGVHVGETSSRRFIILQTGDHQTTEIYLIDAANVESAPVLVAGREPGHEYSVEHHGDRLIISTNSGGAEDFRIVETPLSAPGRENWREIEAHRQGRLILDVQVFQNFLVRLEREHGLPQVVIRRWADGEEHAISFDEEAYSLGVVPGFEFDTTVMRFNYSSMTTPGQVFDYDMASRERRLRKTQEVPSGHRPADYITRRVFAPAEDGELVPVSLIYRADIKLDGSAPLLLYGYGAYGISMPASFSTNRLSLVDRGFVFAMAHIRGGKDKGYRWYREGRRAQKVNTFTDFIAAGRYLAANGFTSPGKIVAHGGSAGGLLMGAVANMAPELFQGILAEVPFVDVLTTMLDDSLPLTPPEWPEWGNPITSPVDYRTIAAYSPYDNVSAQNYPHILAMGGLTDPRVTYWEPAKWVARLRASKTDSNLLLLKTNMDAGHGGASGRFDRLKEVAFAYAFALMIAGKDGGTAAPAAS